jgi:hypothetical protein
MYRLLSLLPVAVHRRLLRRVKVPLAINVAMDSLDRPHYLYGVYWAARQAKALGLTRISTIEFGVAGGRGLIALEEHACRVEADTGVNIDVYGFDTGVGMPPPLDYRDCPYIWQEGFFRMDADKLRQRLSRARLVLGDVSTTIPAFQNTPGLAPIGFISFDLDYYSSTVDALKMCEYPHELFLPRAYCYFDDCTGGRDWELHSEFTGELLAINEFNERHSKIKMARIGGLREKRRIPSWWNERMFALHRFDSPLYPKPIHGNKNWQLALR